MIRNYLKIAWRNLLKNKLYSFINVFGLAMGMAVTMLIGLWVWDELSFNKSFKNYDGIGQLYQNRTFDGETGTYPSMAMPIGQELRTKYPEFKKVALAQTEEHNFLYQDKKLNRTIVFAEPDFLDIFSVQTTKGASQELKNINSLMLSESMAKTFFGTEDPIGKVIKLDNKVSLQVISVFQDFSKNTAFSDVSMIAPFTNYISLYNYQNEVTNWGRNNEQCYVLMQKNAQLGQVQAKIKNLILNKVSESEKASKPELLLHPMSKWHLHDNFVKGVNQGGAIEMVWLFGIIGVFVMLLACINFMNLSTARSEKRAKEVGIRKAVGSLRGQLIYQFLSESLLAAFIAFVVSITLVVLLLPWFNDLANKQIELPISNPIFIGISLSVVLLIGLLSGSYPALYLSSFNSIQTLKGTFRVGRFAAIPRKVLVVVQFTVSVTIIIGTAIVYQQISHVKDRPIGFERNNLIYHLANTAELSNLKYDVLRNSLLATNVVEEVSQSDYAVTSGGTLGSDFKWDGMDQKNYVLFEVLLSTFNHAKTVGLQVVEGRDFSEKFSTDSSAILINETAANLIGRKNIIGKIIRRNGMTLQVVGVVKDALFNSPYRNAFPQIYAIDNNQRYVINIRLKSTEPTSTALAKVGEVFKKLNPSAPFDYKFVDKEFAKKFNTDERIGKLSAVFAVLAIFISCLGLFGLASFVAEQRTKEIGVRKVLGATTANLWTLLSKDFVLLVLISFFIASPIAYYLMSDWINKYTYHTEISWLTFVLAGIGALLIALLTVSYQAITAALMNPVKSLKTE
ncbi:MAG: ABC transporter permease [Emticicia sp.]|uniref:ABC transporter permease n=1 Tax=Emticicia sp. TaxID=1930953 RepID=UPI003BA632E5